MNLANGSFPVIWFGEVRNTENYVDVRVAYNREELFLRLHVFDRRCWYDRYAPFDEPTQWDAAAIYLNLTGNVGSVPTPQTYRFVAQFDYYPKPPDETKTDVYRGNGSGWSPIEVPFTLISSYTGHEPNDDGDDRGWTAVIRIPFSSLGLQEMPNTGSIWGLSIVNYDRDDANGATVDYKTWPRSPDFNQPASWGQLRFGKPGEIQTNRFIMTTFLISMYRIREMLQIGPASQKYMSPFPWIKFLLVRRFYLPR